MLFKEILYNLFKKNIWAIFLSSLFIFIIIWAGSTISVITSRDILEPLTITIEGLNDKDLASVRVLATLSRANNTISLNGVPGHLNQWNNPNKTFIKKIMFGFKAEQLNKLSQVVVNLGERNFVFTKEQFLSEWKKIEIKGSENLFLYNSNGDIDYLIYEAPDKIKAKPLNFPVVSRIFSSINFGGSEKLIQKPVMSSLKTFVLIELVIFLSFFLLSFFKRKNNNDVVIDDKDTDTYKREFIIFGLSIVGAMFVLFIFNLLLLQFYKPDSSIVLETASKIYRPFFLPGFLPEPMEKVQFIFSVLLSPFLLFAFYRFFNKKFLKETEIVVERLYYILSIVFPLMIFAIIYIGLAVSDFFYIGSSFILNNVGKYFYGVLLFPIVAYYILASKRENAKIIKTLSYVFSGLLIVGVFFVNIFSSHSESFVNNLFVTFHLNPLFYPMAQVMAGKTILVNVTSMYGFFPIFLEKIFDVVGLSVLSFSTLMSLLLSCSYLFLFIFLCRIIKNNIILLFGFSTIIYYFLEISRTDSNTYFQYWPIRIFFPCLILMLISFYARNKKKYLFYLISITSVLAVLWNLDSGIIVFLSWVATLCYGELFNENKKIAIKNILLHILFELFLLCSVFVGYVVYAFLRSGLLPDLSLVWQFQKIFVSGYGMIPMPFPHIWLFVAVIFLAGLLLSIRGWQNKGDSFKNTVIFFLSVMGIGLFSYYQGRSHDWVFFGPLYTALALLIIFADSILSSICSNRKLYGSQLIFLFILFFIVASPINIIYNSGKYYKWVKLSVNAYFDNSETVLTRNIDFIKQNTNKLESVVILAEDGNNGLYYGESGTRAAVDLPSSTDIYFNSEVDYLIDFLRCNNSHKLFVLTLIDNDYSYFYDKKVGDIIKSDYIMIKKNSDGMVLLEKKVGIAEICNNLRPRY